MQISLVNFKSPVIPLVKLTVTVLENQSSTWMAVPLLVLGDVLKTMDLPFVPTFLHVMPTISSKKARISPVCIGVNCPHVLSSRLIWNMCLVNGHRLHLTFGKKSVVCISTRASYNDVP